MAERCGWHAIELEGAGTSGASAGFATRSCEAEVSSSDIGHVLYRTCPCARHGHEIGGGSPLGDPVGGNPLTE
jgi:hypothetical protein